MLESIILDANYDSDWPLRSPKSLTGDAVHHDPHDDSDEVDFHDHDDSDDNVHHDHHTYDTAGRGGSEPGQATALPNKSHWRGNLFWIWGLVGLRPWSCRLEQQQKTGVY